jgi:hypothetical protein
MKSPVNLELIFPIKDAPSASFMSFKASCLRDAGIITESEKHWVDARVLSVLAGKRTQQSNRRKEGPDRLLRRTGPGV